MRMGSKVLWLCRQINNSKAKTMETEKMNNYCKKCRLRDGCIRKCKEAEVYEQGYNVNEFKNAKKSVKVYEA